MEKLKQRSYNRKRLFTCKVVGEKTFFSLIDLSILSKNPTMKYILTIDQGTTSCRAIIFDENGFIKSIAQKEFTQYYPQLGWVEHDANEIWNVQYDMIRQAIQKAQLKFTDIAAIGITNQRETTVVWDRNTGEPVCKAIVWQDRRTAAICDKLRFQPNFEQHVRKTTGLVIDAYFSGTKLKWILDTIPNARKQAEAGNLLFGTIDSWLIWKLTGGWLHATDYSNASRTLLYNITKLDWDNTILDTLDIPRNMLPEVRNSSGFYEKTDRKLFDGVEIPITGVAGDQQAALFGQACLQAGMVKNTYGTGCFMLKNTGSQLVQSQKGMVSSIAWGIDDKIEYAMEGSVFIAGAAIQWLRDGLKMIDEAKDSEYFASKVPDAGGVYIVPAFSGLGAPYWDMYARGAIFGLTRGTTHNHFIRATLDALAYQTKDVLEAMQQETGIAIKSLRVDGGATANNLLMQFQADILGVEVQRPEVIESTARGAAFLAGIGIGLWKKEDVTKLWALDKTFTPDMPEDKRKKLYKGWQEAIKRSMKWEESWNPEM
jgi:glycerol kinase